MKRILRSAAIQGIGIMLVAAAWKAVFFFWDVIPFNADEAVVALMARHILQGERPIFFYGQAYMGSLDAFLVAGGFLVFGQQVWVIRLVQSLLYLGTVLTTILLGKAAFHSWPAGLLAGLLLAVPSVNVLLYTTASLGGYGEALLLGNLLLQTALVAARRLSAADARMPWKWFVLWGWLAGCGLWANGLTLVYSIPSGAYLLWAFWKSRRAAAAHALPALMFAASIGFLAGALPWMLFAFQNGLQPLIYELFGTAVAVERDPWLVRTGLHLVSFFLLGISVIFGLRPPWDVRWLALPLIPLVLFFWAFVAWFWRSRWREPDPHRAEYGLLAGVVGVLVAGFLFTPFGVDPSGRYFVPLSVPLALAAAQMLVWVRGRFGLRAWHTAALVSLIIVFHAAGTIQSGLAYPPGITTQFYTPSRVDHRAAADLAAFLRANGEQTGYTNYWVAYPLAFASREELVFLPRLPYHPDLRYTPRDDRYHPYTQIVRDSRSTAYITTHNPRLDTQLRAGLEALSVSWKEAVIGDYRVYYALSRPVHPQEMGLGALRE